MDFLNRGIKQVTDLFQTMTPAARLTTGLLIAVLVISFAFIFRQNVEGGGEYLFGAVMLSGPELAIMEGVFADAGLEDGRREGNRIRVPSRDKYKYMAALNNAGIMPENSRTAFQNMDKNRSPLDTRYVLEGRERHASEQNLEHMIRDLNGIDKAMVRITAVDKGGFPRRKTLQAVATVSAVGNRHLDRDQVATIRDLVAGSSGAEREEVTVIDSNANLSYRGRGKDGMSLADEDPYASRVKLYENQKKRSIENMLLAIYPGALVEVRVELGREAVNRVNSYTYDAQAVTVKQSSATKTDSSTSAANGGRPGFASNSIANTPQQVGGLANNENKSEETSEETQAVPSATQTTIHKHGFVPERVTASIRIPRSLFRTIWMVENAPASGEDPLEPDQAQLDEIELREVADIKKMVTALLPPPPPGDDTFPMVTVIPYTSTPVDAPIEPGLAANAGGWFANNWRTIGLFGAALFSVFFLRGMIQANSSAPAAAANSEPRDPAMNVDGLDDEEDELELTNSLKAKFQHPERSLRDELTELVHEDPDAAANVLANWIGDAA